MACDRAFARRAAIFGEFHRDTAESLLDLATIQERLGKIEEAEDLQVRFAVVQAKRQGNTSRAVKAALKKLAEFAVGREEQGDWAQATPFRENTHRPTVEIFGEVRDEATKASALLSRAADQAGQ